MSYKINTTDGTLLVDLIDGRIDNNTTDLTLIGRNYTGYGELFNENFIKLLENFANTSAPSNPIRGQLWYDTSEGRLKIYDGTTFKSTDATISSATQPALLEGELWVDTANKQLKFSDGNQVYLAGPIYTGSQGVTGFDVQTILDRNGNPRVVARLMIGAQPVAIISRESFIAAQNITNFGTTIDAGINISSAYPEFTFHGSAESTNTLLDSSNNPYTTDDFLKVSENNTTTGSLHVKNDLGLIVGDDSDFIVKVEGTNVILRNQLSGSDMKFQIRQGLSNVEVITVDNSESRIGLWQSSPQFDVDINGDVRISGNLRVDGATTSLDVSTLRVEDKLIELAITSDSTLLTDVDVDGAGIVIRATGDDKSLTWNNTYNSWNSSTHFNVPTGFAYKIGFNNILTETALSSTVTSAAGLTQIGTLTNLDVDNINLNNATITTSVPLTITSAGDITVSSFSKILGVGTPDISDDPNTVATKEYVDDSYLDRDVWLSLDITGLTNTQIASILEDIIPGVTKNPGAYALIHCVSYAGSYTYNGGDGVSKSFVAVDKNGTENQSVVQDFSFSDVTDSVTLTVTRSLKRFIVNGLNQWTFDTDLVSSV